MDFQIFCQCGKTLTVSEGAAGATLTCTCGKSVAVPSLDELRRQTGQPTAQPSAKLLIEAMLADGELPTTTDCAGCGRPTCETVHLTAECEKSFGGEPSRGGAIVAFLLLGFWGWWLYLFRIRDEKEYGDNLILHLPLRVCPKCRQTHLGGSFADRMGAIAIALVFCGAGALYLRSIWAVLFFGGAFAAAITKFLATMRRQRTYAWLLLHEPIYGRLLDDYPEAVLLVSDDQKET